MRRYSSDELAACGSVTASELEPRRSATGEIRRKEYVWRPTSLIAGQLPPNFEVRVLAVIGSDGIRRFRDAAGVKTHIFHGFAAGVALLDHLRGFTAEERLKYRPPFFVYQYTQEMHAHLDCSFRSKQQLVIKRGSRGENQDRSVLPEDLGLNRLGRGRRWTISVLLDEGAAAAARAGIERPQTADKITYGLFAAACRHPLKRTTKQVRNDIRRALFDAQDIVVAPRKRLVDTVRERLYGLMDRHLDDSQAEFDRWFFPAGNRNWPRAVARQSNRPGGELAKEDVTAALLHLGWEAYERLSECLRVFGQVFLAALPEPLSRREKTLFDLTMMPHRYFGGLPRWLLMERIELLRPALDKLLANPRDCDMVGALHRLLTWYPEMVHKRREADRTNKRRTTGRRQVTGMQELFETELAADGELKDENRHRRRDAKRRRDG